jgi:hypothetical protein
MRDYQIYESDGLVRIKFSSDNGSKFDHILPVNTEDTEAINSYIETQIYLQDVDFFEYEYGKTQDQLSCFSDDIYINGFLFRRDYYDGLNNSDILKEELKNLYSFYNESRIAENYPKEFFIDRTSKNDFFLVGKDLEQYIHLYFSRLNNHKRSLFQIFNASFPYDNLRGYTLIHSTKRKERLLKIYHFDPNVIPINIFETIPSELIWDIQTVLNKSGEFQSQNILFYPDDEVLKDVLERWNLNSPLPVKNDGINCYSYGIKIDKEFKVVSASAQAKSYFNE